MDPSNTTGHDIPGHKGEEGSEKTVSATNISEQMKKSVMSLMTAKNNPLQPEQLYADDSQFTFRGVHTEGAAEIAKILNSHPLNQYSYKIGKIDYLPSPGTGGMLAFFTGLVQIIGEERAHSFSRVFHLMPTPEGSCYVQNDILHVDSA